MKNIKKLVLGLAIAIIATIGFDVKAETIKEDAALFNSDIYVIGSTKFDSNFIITASRAAMAGADEAIIQERIYGNSNFNSSDIKTYYYCALDNTWSEIEENGSGLRELTATEVQKLTQNLNLFFVNNKVKTIEVPFTGTIDKDSMYGYGGFLANQAKIENGKIIVPATWINGFAFTSNGIDVEIKLGSTSSTGEIKEEKAPLVVKAPEFILNLPDTIHAGKEFEFTLKIESNSFENDTYNAGGANISSENSKTNYLEKLEYFDEKTQTWKEIGSMMEGISTIKNTTIKYRATLNYAGNYNMSINVVGADFRAYTNKKFTVSLHPNDVALVGTTYYTDLNDAITSNNDSTIKLLKDVTFDTKRLSISNTITLDLNGNTIYTSGLNRVQAISSGNLTIKNGTINATNYALQAQDNATLTVEKDVNIVVATKEDESKYGITMWDNAILNFEGNIEVKGNGYGISGNGGYPQNTQINIIDGTITATDGAALYLPQTGTTTITGGTLIGDTTIGIKAGVLNITGGKLTATGDKKDPVLISNGFNYTGDVIYVEENKDYQDNISINITGGTLASTNGYIIQEYNPTLGTTNELTATITGLYSTKNLITGTTNRFFYN